ncbi:uncharacterized protein LOC114267362 [Camellia sinensis]|uniref:uncharacterized protein LOC114267362 n=1 Tax=Camellia sinensis TaxID=4442 RepID=UPI0010357A77|nr:uncharacterized protein LOC114267362 [Camellia sinensis]
MEFMSVDSVGSAGGLLCIWNPVVFQLKNCCCNRNFILLAGSIFFSFNCVIVNVYGPNDPVGRKRVWDILVNLKSQFLEPWCLGGDFNEIKSISERKGCSRRDKGMREFNELIEQLEVFDLPMCGRKFTWCHSQEGDRWSRLDRFLLNPEWLQTFNFKLWGLPRLVSDHCPIILMEDERDWGPRPFRGGIRRCLEMWKCKLKATDEEVHALDLVVEARVLSADEVARKRELKGDAWQLSKMLERMWFQKSRLKWALLGDRNTPFFHAMARCRSNRNAICSILVSGITVEEPLAIKAEVFKHFSNMFEESWRVRPTLNGPFKSIGEGHDSGFLEAEFSEEEILSTIKSCGGNKALGPSVSSVYQWFELGFGANSLIYTVLWKAPAPPRAQFFGWLV